MSNEMVYVAMMPLHFAAYQRWLDEHGLTVGQLPDPGVPGPVYVVTPKDPPDRAGWAAPGATLPY
jgi:hypothetical protein